MGGTMFTVRDGEFDSLNKDQRDCIRTVIRISSGKMLDAHAKVPRTKAGIEAKALLVEANEWLMDLHTYLKGKS